MKINNNLIEHSYILATTTTGTSNFTKITLNSIVSSEGDFTLNNGNVVIPSGVSLVRVSGGIMGDTTNTSTRYLWGNIKHNEAIVSSNMSPVNGDNYTGCSISPTLIEVSNGDTITLGADNTAGVKNRTGRGNTWLLVEKIK